MASPEDSQIHTSAAILILNCERNLGRVQKHASPSGVRRDRRRSSEIVGWMTLLGGLGEECGLRFFLLVCLFSSFKGIQLLYFQGIYFYLASLPSMCKSFFRQEVSTLGAKRFFPCCLRRKLSQKNTFPFSFKHLPRRSQTDQFNSSNFSLILNADKSSLFGERVKTSRGERRDFFHPIPKQRACSQAKTNPAYISLN